ncbi:kinase-like protein [Piromyces finnis]|uniref:Kinase-like protein n=1 Tax=Piromyces finnis TaxID=1754191 RepID=A0A1Y1VFM6_9FUNG|nr:kinase-like protein [Piromyces finnis]|eukprot:ORX55224.1 kinase-like protein [Piromyces finnis]
MIKNNKSSDCYNKNITNSIFANDLRQQFPFFFSYKKLEENNDFVDVLSLKDYNSEYKTIIYDYNNSCESSKDNFDELNRNGKRINKNSILKNNLSINSILDNKNKNNNDNNIRFNYNNFESKKGSILLRDKDVRTIIDSQEKEKQLYNNGASLINRIIKDDMSIETSKNEIKNIFDIKNQKYFHNDKYKNKHYYYEYFNNPFIYYLTKFNYLLSQWKMNGKIDSRYENLLDEIINDIRNGKYKIPFNIEKRYLLDFSKIEGSGSNGRVFYAIDNITKKEVVLKITLSVYGSSYEEQMLKYCKSKYTVSLIESYNDNVISIIVIDLFGTIWSPENKIINSLTHEGLDYEFYRENNKNEKRVNIRDLYACVKIHKYFPENIIKKIMKQLILLIYHFHLNLGVTHGDIKLQNILIDQNYEIKIIDFSAMRFIKNGKIKNFSGARMFAAPEALKGDFDGRLNDIWAIGIIFYKLLYGVNKNTDFDKENNLILVESNNINEDAIDLLHLLLTYDYSKRPFIENIVTHPYIL